jgi:hypothetical protein
MESVILKQTSKRRTWLLVAGVALCTIALFCFVFQISPKSLAIKLSDISKHHYFLTGFVSLLIAIIPIRIFMRLSTTSSSGFKIVDQNTGIYSKRIRVMIQNLRRSLRTQVSDESSVFIAKKDLAQLNLTNEEVLQEQTQIINRQKDLERALILSIVYKQKIIICFIDKKNNIKRHTLASIWHVDDANVCIKAGDVISVIPVKSIYKVEI